MPAIRGVVGVEQRPSNVSRGVHAGVGQHGFERHFSAVALAFGINGEPAHDERGQIQREGVGGELMNHRGSGALLQCGARPATHEDAIAGVASLGGVGVGVAGVAAARGVELQADAVGDGAEGVDHLLVAADVACCEDDRFGAVILDVFAVFRGRDNARDTALGIAHKLLGVSIEDEFGPVFDGGVVEYFSQGPVDALAIAAHIVGLIATNEGYGVGVDAPLAVKLIPAVVFRGA